MWQKRRERIRGERTVVEACEVKWQGGKRCGSGVVVKMEFVYERNF